MNWVTAYLHCLLRVLQRRHGRKAVTSIVMLALLVATVGPFPASIVLGDTMNPAFTDAAVSPLHQADAPMQHSARSHVPCNPGQPMHHDCCNCELMTQLARMLSAPYSALLMPLSKGANLEAPIASSEPRYASHISTRPPVRGPPATA